MIDLPSVIDTLMPKAEARAVLTREDLVQAGVARCLHLGQNSDFEMGALLPTVVKYTYLDALREEYIHWQERDEIPLDATLAPTDPFLYAAARESLEQLGDTERRLLSLALVGMTAEECAKRCDLTGGARRKIKKLRRHVMRQIGLR